MCGGLTPLAREGTLIVDILRDLQRQVIARLIVNYYKYQLRAFLTFDLSCEYYISSNQLLLRIFELC